jgi:2-dehydro-3-deoxyphosphogluconate aldolase/(4S)-4-hydroxy-2-oxoglutarate aldolase
MAPMARSKDQMLAGMLEVGVVAIIRAPSPQHLAEVAQALLAGGISAVEVTMTTPKALWGIEMLSDRFGDEAIIGVGTVLDAATCRDAIAAGAQFVISPHFDDGVVATTRRYGKISIPGGLTPTEILRAWTAGADLVKVFPSSTLGPGYIRDLLAPLPQLRLTPTGGVDVKNTPEWIKAGAACVGAGSSLVSKDALAKGDWPAITAIAKAFVDAVRSARK